MSFLLSLGNSADNSLPKERQRASLKYAVPDLLRKSGASESASLPSFARCALIKTAVETYLRLTESVSLYFIIGSSDFAGTIA
jgi:hypothetical protein